MYYVIDSPFFFDYTMNMLLSEKQTIEDYIIESLAKLPYQTGPELVNSINTIRKGTTKQAVYVVLQPLLITEVIAKVNSKYYISKLWIDKISLLLNIQNYNLNNESIFELKNNESISYKFPSLMTCDTYWAHLFNLLIKWIPHDQPIFVWNPHEWFVIGRSKEEEKMFNLFEENNKTAFYTISGDTQLDKLFKKTSSNNVLKINIGNNIPLKQNYYVNIFSDYIIEVYLNKELTNNIENFYQKNTTLTKKNIKYFENLINEKYPVRMKISKNKDKASLLRKKLSKDFYIPSEYKI